MDAGAVTGGGRQRLAGAAQARARAAGRTLPLLSAAAEALEVAVAAPPTAFRRRARSAAPRFTRVWSR